MNVLKSKRGAAPTLVILIIFIIISSGLVVAYFRSAEREEVSTIQQLAASDVAKATNSSIETELDDALSTGATAAMYDVGMRGGTRKNVENRVINYLNAKIRELTLENWKYPNLEVNVPTVTENSITFEWQPNGSVVIWAYLNSKIEHVMGPTACGTFLHTAPHPRFQRIKQVAEQVENKVRGVTSDQIPELEESLNDNYECEGIEIELTLENSYVYINVEDIYGGKTVVLGE